MVSYGMPVGNSRELEARFGAFKFITNFALGLKIRTQNPRKIRILPCLFVPPPHSPRPAPSLPSLLPSSLLPPSVPVLAEEMQFVHLPHHIQHRKDALASDWL